VAAPEVAPPLGRLRRFEADDYGPAPSLSAPTQTASQATAAARIPRFTPAASPSNPPAAPSFTPAAGAGTPAGAGSPAGAGTPAGAGKPAGAGTPAAGAGTPAAPTPQTPQTPQTGQGSTGPQPGVTAPAAGLGDGGLAAARSGWDMGGVWSDGDRDEPAAQALPVRNGSAPANGGPPANGNPPSNGNLPANGNPAADGPPLTSTEPGIPAGPATPAGPGRLPAFTGLSSQAPRAPQFPIGSQNVRGSDGPGVSDAGSAANGTMGSGAAALPGGAGNGSGLDDAATDPGRLTIPPVAPHEQRLPIFDSLESDWFRRSGAPLTAASRTQGVQGAQGPQGTRETQPQSVTGSGSWTSPSDEGWRAAQAVAAPAAGDTTQAGLPRRVPRANLVPGSVGTGGAQGSQETATEAPVRSPDAVRSRMASFQRGVREGRAAAPPQTEEP
jgi:hypothetical protein